MVLSLMYPYIQKARIRQSGKFHRLRHEQVVDSEYYSLPSLLVCQERIENQTKAIVEFDDPVKVGTVDTSLACFDVGNKRDGSSGTL